MWLVVQTGSRIKNTHSLKEIFGFSLYEDFVVRSKDFCPNRSAIHTAFIGKISFVLRIISPSILAALVTTPTGNLDSFKILLFIILLNHIHLRIALKGVTVNMDAWWSAPAKKSWTI